MPKAKQTAYSSFMNASPLKMGATILLVISILANLGTLLFYVLMHHTPHFDTELYNYTRHKICVTDATDMSASYPTLCK